jgi:hypothetical protein
MCSSCVTRLFKHKRNIQGSSHARARYIWSNLLVQRTVFSVECIHRLQNVFYGTPFLKNVFTTECVLWNLCPVSRFRVQGLGFNLYPRVTDHGEEESSISSKTNFTNKGCSGAGSGGLATRVSGGSTLAAAPGAQESSESQGGGGMTARCKTSRRPPPPPLPLPPGSCRKVYVERQYPQGSEGSLPCDFLALICTMTRSQAATARVSSLS